jgi:hypothetical protein
LLCRQDTDHYIAQTSRLLHDPDLRKTLGQAARTAALRWRWEDALDAVTNAYAELRTPFDAAAALT